jgi:hypothetical protein
MDRNAAMIIRITGMLQLAMGIFIWMGGAQGLVPVHMLIGLVFVIAMGLLGFRAVAARVAAGLGVVLIAWGAVVLALGMTHARLMPGPNHGAIQGLHVLVGLAAMGLSEAVAKRLRIAQEKSVPDARPA